MCPVEAVFYTGASGLLLLMLSSLCYQRGILTALRGAKSFQVPAPTDARVKTGARGQLGAAVSIIGQASLRLALTPLGQLHSQVLRNGHVLPWIALCSFPFTVSITKYCCVSTIFTSNMKFHYIYIYITYFTKVYLMSLVINGKSVGESS